MIDTVTISMELTNAKKDLWKVIGSDGKVHGKNLSLKQADDLFCKLTNPPQKKGR